MALTEIPSELSSTPSIVDGGNATAITIDSSENVGVGTSSPASLIDATGAPQATSGSIVRVRNTSATSSNTSFGGVLFTSSPGTDFSIGKSNVNAATSLSFRNGNTGASLMELTSAGNVLVGKSAIDFATAGTEIMDHGEIQVTRTGVPMYLRRNGSDGDILSLYRDGTAVGSIGTNSGYMVIGSPVGTDAHLLIGNNLIHPATSSGGVKDAAIDLGGSSNRFKDLYLSGGVYLGGTGAANKLEDYEEGTWTPACSISALSVSRARYVRIGGVVHLSCTITTSGTMSTGTFQLTGLPYTGINTAHEDIGSVMSHSVGFGGYNQLVSYKYSGSGAIRFYLIKDNAAWALLQGQTGINTSEHIIMSITYKVF